MRLGRFQCIEDDVFQYTHFCLEALWVSPFFFIYLAKINIISMFVKNYFTRHVSTINADSIFHSGKLPESGFYRVIGEQYIFVHLERSCVQDITGRSGPENERTFPVLVVHLIACLAGWETTLLFWRLHWSSVVRRGLCYRFRCRSCCD